MIKITCMKTSDFREDDNYLCCYHMLRANRMNITHQVISLTDILKMSAGKANPTSAFVFVTESNEVLSTYHEVYHWLTKNGLFLI